MLEIKPISAFNDNYIWLLQNGSEAWVVDPGDAAPVTEYLTSEQLTLRGILITHHHPDHTGGVNSLKVQFNTPVYGAAVAGITDYPMTNEEIVNVLGFDFRVISVPGHTLDHICFYSTDAGALFSGDTLFFAGCGRLFEGSAKQMFHALSQLAQLPDDTKVYCAHEYTLSNLQFAAAVEPDSPYIISARRQCEALRAAGEPTLPTTIGAEKCHNPFLRSHQPPVIAAASERTGQLVADPVEVFTAIRQWKDSF